MNRIEFPWIANTTIQSFTKFLFEDLVDEGTLTTAADTRYANELTQRDFNIDIFQVVVPSPTDLDHAGRVTLAPFFRNRDLQSTAQILSRQTGFRFDNLRRVPLDHHFTATNARTGPEIDQVVTLTHRIFIMLDHDNRVPQITKMLKRVDQPVIVTRVQPDRRLVQNVQHADQSGTDLSGQANPLSLTARQGRRGAVEHQII